MHATDVLGYTYEGDVYCPNCLKDQDTDDPVYGVIFTDNDPFEHHCGQCGDNIFPESVCMCRTCTRGRNQTTRINEVFPSVEAIDSFRNHLNRTLRGSGYDSRWTSNQRRNGTAEFTGRFHPMDENGFYLTWFIFVIKVWTDDSGERTELFRCVGGKSHLRRDPSLKEMMQEDFYSVLEEWLKNEGQQF